MTNSHDEKRSDDSYKGVEPEVVVTDAYPTDVERHLEEKDHHLAITNEGDHGTKRALVSADNERFFPEAYCGYSQDASLP